MKKFTLFFLAISFAKVSFGQTKTGKTTVNAALLSKTQHQGMLQTYNNSQGTVYYTAPSHASKVSYMTQNFDGTWLPTSWTTTVLLTAKTWQQGNPAATPYTTIDPANLYSAICPYCLPTETQNEWLKTPSITGTAAATSLFLKFWLGFSYDYLPAGGLGVPGATLQCKISTNGGTSWTTLWDANTVTAFTGWGWREVSCDISAYKSAPFMIAWNITGADGDLFGLDNISIAEPAAIDAGVTAITAPLTTCNNLSSAENIVVTIKNNGATAISNFPVSYKINNNTPVTVTYTGSIASAGTASYTFTGANAANLSVAGLYKIKAYTSLSGDGVATNDTTTANLSIGTASIPYAMGFEATDNLAGWTVLNTNADAFTWGIYTGAQYAHTGTGFAAYPYNTNGTTAADDWIFTKCISMFAGTNYRLRFYYRAFNSAFAEAMNVKIGTVASVAGMTTQLVDLPSITDTTYPVSNTTFTVPASGTYYIGFHAKSAADADYLIIDDVSIDIVADVAENPSSDISMFPNPASTMLTINSPEKIKHIKVINLLGSVVFEQDIFTNSLQLNTSDYTKGIYFVVVTTEKQNFTRKIQIIK